MEMNEENDNLLKDISLKYKHPEDYCHICLGDNILWYAENDLFNKVNGSGNGIMCPKCFLKMASDKGIELIFKPELINK